MDTALGVLVRASHTRPQPHAPPSDTVGSPRYHTRTLSYPCASPALTALNTPAHSRPRPQPLPCAAAADPICTFIFAALVLGTTPGIVKKAMLILLNYNPLHESHDDILADLQARPSALPAAAALHAPRFASPAPQRAARALPPDVPLRWG